MSKKRRVFFVTLRRIKIHEFDLTIRRIYKSESWIHLFEKLGDLQQRAIATFIKSSSPLIAAYLIISSLNANGKVGVTYQGISASIPTAYLSVIVSTIYLFACLSLVHLVVIISLRVRHSGRLYVPGLSTNIIGLLQGHEESVLGLPTLATSFLKEIIPISTLLTTLFLFAFLGLSIPFFAFGYFLSTVQIELILTESTPVFEKIAAFSGLCLVLLSVLYVILFHIPLPFKKNMSFIRWNFLASISTSFPHPQANKWLKK
jgi:hypothetical protein